MRQQLLPAQRIKQFYLELTDEIYHATPILCLIEHDGPRTNEMLLNHPNEYFDSHEVYSVRLEFEWKYMELI